MTRGLNFDISHLLAGGMVLVSFMLLYQDRVFSLLRVFALHALVLALSVAWQAHVQAAPHLYLTAMIALTFKAIVIPVALHRIVVRLEISHPFREEGLIDQVVETLIEQGLDSVFTAYEDHHNFWKVNQFGELEPISDERHTRSGRPPLYKEMSGLASATRAEVARAGERLGKRVGVVALTSLYALVDTQDEIGLELARRLH